MNRPSIILEEAVEYSMSNIDVVDLVKSENSFKKPLEILIQGTPNPPLK